MNKPGLYANIHAKRKRIKAQKVAKKKNPKVKVEKMAKVGNKNRPTAKQFAQAAKTRIKPMG